MSDRVKYVRLDVHKEGIVVAVADGGIRGEVREYGRIGNTAAALDRLTRKLGHDGVRLRFCYEDGVHSSAPYRFDWPRRILRRDGAPSSTGGPAMYYIGIDVSTKGERALRPGRQRQDPARDQATDRSRNYRSLYRRHRACHRADRLGVRMILIGGIDAGTLAKSRLKNPLDAVDDLMAIDPFAHNLAFSG
jgi:hypothetical protein